MRAPLLEPAAPAFPSLEAAALFGGAPAQRAEAGAEVVERSAPRRILPSLIETPEPKPETVEAPLREPRLPRVRRVKLPRAEAPGKAARREALRPEVARPEQVAAPVARVEPVAPARPLPAKAEASLSKAAEPIRRAARRPEKALPLGERWKRRLPRVCW